MATKKNYDNEIRADFIGKLTAFFAENGEDVMQIESNMIAFPYVDPNGDEKEVQIKVSVPKKIEEGDTCYERAAAYKAKVIEKAEGAKAKAEAKAKKIARDKAAREAREKAKAEHLAEKE